MDNPLVVQWEYASEERLAVRNQVTRELIEGTNPEELAFEAVAECKPERLLEIGCGMGELAVRARDELGAAVVAQDISPRMVELTRARGIEAEVGDVQALPYPDGGFDCVVANWVLYHVPDLALGIRELARVLRPGGRLVAATLGDGNMQELWELVGGSATSGLSFACANGAAALEKSFARVERRPADGAMLFPTREAVRQYVAATTTRSHLAENVPELQGPLRVRSSHCVFVAEKAAVSGPARRGVASDGLPR